MKISVDDKELFTLSETQKRVIMNDIQEDIFEDDMKRRLQWVLTHKYEQCFERLKRQWDPLLKDAGVAAVPLDSEAYAELVFAQPGYMSRAQREAADSLQSA